MPHHHPEAFGREVREMERALDNMHASRHERDAARQVFRRLMRVDSVTLGEARRRALKVVTDARTRVHDATTGGA